MYFCKDCLSKDYLSKDCFGKDCFGIAQNNLCFLNPLLLKKTVSNTVSNTVIIPTLII